jgi:hypothetical protein
MCPYYVVRGRQDWVRKISQVIDNSRPMINKRRSSSLVIHIDARLIIVRIAR